ncbi:MAG TPA: hypothetical protein VGP25_00210 [Gemmatimonadaceae bacterium]|nr:hypothetical protein [Gemmatimonadaceae bacterium]
MSPNKLCRVALSLAFTLSSTTLAAQSHANEPPVCLGFAFGAWTPALDWRAAGHPPLDPKYHLRADDGRDWATTDAVPTENTVVLLPQWWPAGVSVTLPNRAPALGDTVVGSAFAFVADGRRIAPRSQVRAWRVRCGAPAPRTP